MAYRKHLAKTLRQLREQNGFSQEALADAAGLHRTYISQLEREKKSPTLDVLERLARAHDLSLRQFLTQFSRGLAN